MQRGFIAAALLCLAAAPAQKATSLLTARDLDPALVLPPPPASDSAQAVAELVELRAFGARDAATEAEARRDGDTKNATIFAVVLGPGFDLTHLPATAALMALVRASEKDIVDRGKHHFRRARPYVSDPTLKPCKRNDDPLSSYPSGHTSMAFSMAETLARLVPEKAEVLLTRAARYGQSRIVCQQHFRSDVSAGQMLGVLIAERLTAKPAFRAAFDSARRELVSVGIAQP